VKKLPPYSQVNPFSFDEELARQAATAEYDPYYQQQITDYTSQVERTKARSAEDLQSTLSFLTAGKDSYVGNERRLLDLSIKSTNNGYAGNGLFFSGARKRDIGTLQENTSQNINDYMRGYNYNTAQAEKSNIRTGQDVTTAQNIFNRDIAQSEKAAIEGGVLQRRQEALDEYNIGAQTYYQNAYG